MTPGSEELGQIIAASVAEFDQRPCLIEAGGEVLSYAGFGERLRQVTTLLRERRVGRGDVVTRISDNSIDLAVALFGVISFGAVAMPLNPKLKPQEIETLRRHSRSTLLLRARIPELEHLGSGACDIAAYRQVRPARGRLEMPPADAGALLIYTSGTTGSPKGVLLRHSNIAANVRAALTRLPFAERHTTLCCLPLFHTFGFISDLSTMLFAGGTTVLMPTFDIKRVGMLETAIREHEVRSFSAVPLIFNALLSLGCRLGDSRLKFCVSGAAPLAPQTIERFSATYDVPIIPAYGLTETTCFCTISPPRRIVPRSAGTSAGGEIRVVSEGGDDLGVGEIGELIVKGPSVMSGGYYRDDRQCYHPTGDRWFMTGDLGYLDAEGYVYITGRKKNMVIRGGEKIYLEDLDRCLLDCLEVRDSATVRVDRDGVEKIACFVVPRERAVEPRRIKEFIAARVGREKQPDRVLMCEEIPRTATNKVRLAELQKIAEARL